MNSMAGLFLYDISEEKDVMTILTSFMVGMTRMPVKTNLHSHEGSGNADGRLLRQKAE